MPKKGDRKPSDPLSDAEESQFQDDKFQMILQMISAMNELNLTKYAALEEKIGQVSNAFATLSNSTPSLFSNSNS